MKEYYDKHGKRIEPGMTLRHINGDEEEVHDGEESIGFIASKDRSLIYPLSGFNLSEWEII